MGSDFFSIGVSALNAAQMQLATTQNNIANANTPGYNREQVVQAANPALLTGSGYIGQGVDVTTIKRIYDQFLSGQLMQQQGQAAQSSTYYNQIQQIDNLLADPTAGLSPALQNFFNSVNTVASTPGSQAARQSMLSSAQSLVSSFQMLNQQLTGLNSSINGQVSSNVATINSYSQQIAALNQSIVQAQAASNNQPPNGLLDQRDQLISQLNQIVNATVVKQSDGSYNVSIGTGQMLVAGANSFNLQAVQSPSDPTQTDVALGTSGGAIIRLQQSSLSGGSLGGIIAFRQTLDNTQNTLGLIATGLAGTFNQQSQLGLDLNGALGGNFFTQALPVVNNNALNTGNAQISASISNTAALSGSDYTLRYDGTSYTLTRLSDNTTTNLGTLATPATVDGLNISVASGVPAAGDSFLIRPTVNGAQGISVAITDPSKIAAASPVRTDAALANTGTGNISPATVTPPLNANLMDNVTVSFVDATHYVVTDNTTATTLAGSPTPVVYDPTAGATLSFNGWSAQLSGAPAAGDSFTIAPNNNATADGSNALLLAGLQTQGTLSNGTLTYQDMYSQLVNQVGNQTSALQISSTAQATMVSQTQQAQQAVSGVNLNEEAANLILYQQSYQAAGKAIQIANTLFDTLLQI
jgi:flagellar hook-associated protein 1 FlgK